MLAVRRTPNRLIQLGDLWVQPRRAASVNPVAAVPCHPPAAARVTPLPRFVPQLLLELHAGSTSGATRFSLAYGSPPGDGDGSATGEDSVLPDSDAINGRSSINDFRMWAASRQSVFCLRTWPRICRIADPNFIAKAIQQILEPLRVTPPQNQLAPVTEADDNSAPHLRCRSPASPPGSLRLQNQKPPLVANLDGNHTLQSTRRLLLTLMLVSTRNIQIRQEAVVLIPSISQHQ